MGNIFSNGGMFGKPIPLQGAKPMGAVPLQGQGQGAQPVTRPLGVVAPQQAAQAAPAKTPPAFGHQPLIPPTSVPMGKKGECPICH